MFDVLQPLKMLQWLKPYLTEEKSTLLDVQIVHVVNSYCKLCEDGIEEMKALELVETQYPAVYSVACTALRHLIEDEQFLKQIGL